VTPDEVAVGKQATVDAFVLRARRIREHSLWHGPQTPVDLFNPKWHVEVRPDGSTWVMSSYPPEEQVESLAARVRPLILERDQVYFRRVLEALGFLLRGADEEHREDLQTLRRRWAAVDPRGRRLAAYRLDRIDADRPDEQGRAVDSALALAWLYGDVVHADVDGHEDAAAFSVVDRYRAATHAVARIAVASRDTLEFIEFLVHRQVLNVSDQALTVDVVAAHPDRYHKAAVYTAPPGTPPPDISRVPSGEWPLLRPDEQD
jgi:hypothetical protein